MIAGLQQQRDALLAENSHLWQAVEGRYFQQPLLGNSSLMQQVIRLIEQLRDSTVEVLITGESGTGKELAARALHFASRRARNPFVAVNCAALPASLLESEPFGIERGVATGVEHRIGKIESAHGGTFESNPYRHPTVAGYERRYSAPCNTLLSRVYTRIGEGVSRVDS